MIVNRNLFCGDDSLWRQFALRAFRVPEVESVEIDRRRGTATVGYAASHLRLEELLDRLAVAFRRKYEASHDLTVPTPADGLAGGPLRICRRGSRLSFWVVVHELSGRLRIRGPRLGEDAAGRLTTTLRLLRGVQTASVSTLTGSVVIRFDRTQIDREQVLKFLDQCLESGGLLRTDVGDASSRWFYVNATLGLALAGTFVYPPLLPISALLLVATNLRTFRSAFEQARRRRAGLPVLQTAIVGATLATGSFVAASAMNWLMFYWEGRRTRLIARGEQILLRSVDPSLARAVARPLTTPSSSDQSPDLTVASHLAERAVPATLMIAGVALLAADTTAAAALLRPDYATGPSLGSSAALVECLRACSDQGIVVRRVDALQQIVDADLVVVDCDPGIADCEFEARCGIEVERLPSAVTRVDAASADARNLASDDFKARRIAALRAAGRHVVYVGNGQDNPRAAAAADLAISPFPGLDDGADDPSGVWLLRWDLEMLIELRKLACLLKHQSQSTNRLILIPNIVCVAGALLLGFSSLAVVALSNAGTLAVYVRSRDTLLQAERRLRRRRRNREQLSESVADRPGTDLTVVSHRSCHQTENMEGEPGAISAPFPIDTMPIPLETASVTETIENVIPA